MKHISYIIIFACVCVYALHSCNECPTSFLVVDATLQHVKVQDEETTDSIFYVLDLTVIPLDYESQVPLTGLFNFENGIKKKVSSINITNENWMILNNYFTIIPNHIRKRFHKKTTLVLPWIGCEIKTDVCNNINNTKNDG